MLAGGIRMYRHEDYEQLKLELPFGVTLREDNRWVLLSKLFPWEASHSVGPIYKTRFEKQGIKTPKPLISQGFRVSVSILVTLDGVRG